ncbi:MFS transporter [Frankia sp. AgB32]|uniref:MFS transporter n=1 Tax=Frankia sp. AgB32 TaxID=631119 RepID=UPI002010106C|nr:MFS transporter [Frankia sp. AgB32]MCK9895446.1 MFS transporter [Frankia sp. AgB32]
MAERTAATAAATTAAATTAAAAGAPSGLLPVLSGNMILDALEVSIVLLALPVVGADLHASLWTVQWLMSGFALGFAAMLLPGPALAARWGRRRTYLAALLVFALASLVGGLGNGIVVLVAARVVKGGCAALTAPAGLAVISTAYPQGARQRRAVSTYSMFGAAGFTCGLVLSVLLLRAGWRWVFLFPAPVALVLLGLAWAAVPRDEAAAAPRITLSVLRHGALARSAIGAATLNGAYVSLLVLVSARLDAHGWPAWRIALGLLPACVPLMVCVPFAAGLVARFGTARLVAAGAVATFAGELLALARGLPGAYLDTTLPVLLLVEAGFVLSFAALNMQAVSAVPAALRPVAVPVYQTAVQLGGVIMLPLVTALASGHAGRRPLLAVAAAGLVGVAAALGGRRPDPREAPS